MRTITRRQLLKLCAGASAALFLPGCRALLDQISLLVPSPTPPVKTSPLEPPPLRAAETIPTATAAPQAKLKPPGSGSKIGLHVVGGSREGLDEFLARCTESGHPVVLVKCVD